MKNYFLVLAAFCVSTGIAAQDIIVLRKTGEEVKCRIISINDTLVTYRTWKSPDTTLHAVRKFEVMSYLLEKRTRKSKQVHTSETTSNYDTNLLGEYKEGETVPGYVIKNSGDTIRGFIIVKNLAVNQAEIIFRNETGGEEKFSVKNANGYGYRGMRYERIKTGYKNEVTNNYKTPGGSQFLHLSVDGASKLYRFYTLKFNKNIMNQYHGNPPVYLGKLKRHFVITNPAGKQLFTKGRTLTGTLNRIYLKYPAYLAQFPVETPRYAELPEIVNQFNRWYDSNR